LDFIDGFIFVAFCENFNLFSPLAGILWGAITVSVCAFGSIRWDDDRSITHPDFIGGFIFAVFVTFTKILCWGMVFTQRTLCHFLVSPKK